MKSVLSVNPHEVTGAGVQSVLETDSEWMGFLIRIKRVEGCSETTLPDELESSAGNPRKHVDLCKGSARFAHDSLDYTPLLGLQRTG